MIETMKRQIVGYQRGFIDAKRIYERKKGKWVYKPNEYDDGTWECSACGEPWTLIEGNPEDNNMNFCPNCGADMRGEQDEVT